MLSTVPWIPDTADHNQAISNWKASAENRKTGHPTLGLIIQSFLLSQLRSALASDLCQAWLPFGCLAPQLSHLSIVLNLSVVESVGVFPQYRPALATRLSGRELANERMEPQLSHCSCLLRSLSFWNRPNATYLPRPMPRRKLARRLSRGRNSLRQPKRRRSKKSRTVDRISIAVLVPVAVRDRHNERNVGDSSRIAAILVVGPPLRLLGGIRDGGFSHLPSKCIQLDLGGELALIEISFR